MNITTLTSVFEAIAAKIAENKDYLVELDQQNGDGDLGISMNDGYGSTATRQDLPVARYPPFCRPQNETVYVEALHIACKISKNPIFCIMGTVVHAVPLQQF